MGQAQAAVSQAAVGQAVEEGQLAADAAALSLASSCPIPLPQVLAACRPAVAKTPPDHAPQSLDHACYADGHAAVDLVDDGDGGAGDCARGGVHHPVGDNQSAVCGSPGPAALYLEVACQHSLHWCAVQQLESISRQT